MTSPLARYLRAAPPAPNAARPRLPPPELQRTAQGVADWRPTLAAFALSVVALDAPEMAQGLGRLVAACVAFVGGHPAFDPFVDLLERGDAASVLAANSMFSDLREEVGEPWILEVDGRRRPAASRDVDADPSRYSRPGFSLVLGAGNAASACKDRYRRGVPAAWRAEGEVGNALAQLISVVMAARPELGADEALAVAHQLLDPDARQPAPGGLWAEARRRGRRVRVAYGRRAARVVEAEYELVEPTRRDSMPGRAHNLVAFGAPRRAPPPADADAQAALADLVRRGVWSVRLADGGPWLAEQAARAGFDVPPHGGYATIDPPAERALALAHPRAWGAAG